MHEVVTIQLGNRANYLCTHFWNVQESYFTYPTPSNPFPEPSLVDHDIHFRPGIGADGSDTYTPRTLIYDFQTNFGSLRKQNALYEALTDEPEGGGVWDGIQQTHINPPIQPIQYQVDLESGRETSQLQSTDVRYWSDFNRLFYHPRSILPISPQSFSSSLNAQEVWNNGVDLFRDIDRDVDLLDRDVRPFVEEADSLSAFQVFSSVDDSWGGYAANYVEALKEEYGKKSIWIWAVEDERRVERAKRYQRFANSARSLRSMAMNASAYIRLSDTPSKLPDYVQLQPGSEWSTSALLSAAVESVTLPARLRKIDQLPVNNLSMFENALNTNGTQNIWTLKARAKTLDDVPNRDTGATDHNTTSQAWDPRMQSPGSDTPSEETIIYDPAAYDITFTPTLPAVQTALPSLLTSQIRSPSYVFAQVESHRYLPIFKNMSVPASLPVYQYESKSTNVTYNTPLLYPLLNSFPDNLFLLPAPLKHIQINAALDTESRTKRDIFSLRDLVVGNASHGLRLVESDEVEALYDDLTRLGEAYEWGEIGSEDEDWGGWDD